MVRFDILFYVRLPQESADNRKKLRIIVNVEAQKAEPTGYGILNRAVFYVCRMLSSQKGRDFTNSNYDDINQVYSIWVCMNMNQNSMTHIHLTKEELADEYEWNGNLDLLNIVLIGLTNDLPEQGGRYELHRLLGALLSKELTVEEKLEIIEKEYCIPVEEEWKEDVRIMCNLSQGIKEEGIAIGEAKGRAEGEAKGRTAKEKQIIFHMHEKGFSVEQIALATENTPEGIIAILQKGE